MAMAGFERCRTAGRVVVALSAIAAVFVCIAGSASAASPPAPGPVHVFAHVPYPGNPGDVAIDGDTMWVDSSAANFDRPFDGSSTLFAYDARTGQPSSHKPITVPKNAVAAM